MAMYNARRASRLPTNDILDRAIDDLKYAERLDPTHEANSHALEEAYRLKRLGFNKVQVIEDLQLREQPDPRARNILGAPPDDRMPKGSQVAVIDFRRPWMGSGRGAQDADNIWCPVLYEGYRGWANARMALRAPVRAAMALTLPNQSANGHERIPVAPHYALFTSYKVQLSGAAAGQSARTLCPSLSAKASLRST